ncbi:MAG: tetratricopeptide repeat protein [Proteobacteria bacterium]|nr:tetratricopeptide repeat protein [Pseudomonadota bacterium]
MDDMRGTPVSAAKPSSLEIYETALNAFNCYRGDPVEIIDKALADDPGFVMGHIFRAHIHVSLWERSVLSELNAILAILDELSGAANDRERAHVAALKRWAWGDWNGMRAALDRLLAEYPRDLLALQMGHLLDFYHGDRENLRGRIARALPHWNRDDKGYGFILGMQAFGLEECGAYDEAEETGRRAFEMEPDDCWAQHAVAHVMEMQARQDEAIAFMAAREHHWAQDDNAFAFHNWWHTALFHLDQDRPVRALQIYDRGVRAEPAPIQLMMLDAAALLWRLHLRRIDVGTRWEELATAYEKADEAGFYAFNDMHAMMAYVATGRSIAAAALLKIVEAEEDQAGTNGMMTREVGLPIVRAIEAFGREAYGEAMDTLMPVRYRAHIFGGSHAQRDIVHRTLIEAALRSPDKALAIALTNERTSLKPHCPFGLQLKQRATQ